MKIAILGAGYAGLSTAWHLCRKNLDVTVFDTGIGASFASTGLLHPCPGKKAFPSERSEEGMRASLALLEAASFDMPVFRQSGILRYATNPEQEMLFKGKTLWIPEGITVYSRLYCQQLRKMCKGAHFITKEVRDLQELQGFDRIVVAAGAQTLRFVDLPLKRTIGQSLICRCPEPLSYAMLGSGHITPTEDPGFCQVGSTYEYTEMPSEQKALDLIAKVSEFYPRAKEFSVVKVLSGIRVSPKVGYFPIVTPIDHRIWVFTGLGSRGLLYHALLGAELAENLTSF